MFQINAKILYNKRIKKNYYEIALSAPPIAKSALPGQFVNIKVSDGLQPLLRRPFSIHQIYRWQMADGRWQNGIRILYEVVGKGTEILAQRKAGEYLDVIGPLGNGFSYRSPYPVARTPILVAGGMGTAPLVFLAERLVCGPQSTVHRKPLVLIGAKTKDDILCEKEFRKLGLEVKIATDDGSRGFSGRVTELLEDILRRTTDDACLPAGRDDRTTICCACGPTPMLKEISLISKKYHIPAQISLEAHMACGIAACMGCVIKPQTENRKPQTDFVYKRVCKEGPVFEANQIIWD